MNDVMRRKMSSAYNNFEDNFKMAKTSEDGMNLLIKNWNLCHCCFSLHLAPNRRSKRVLLGCPFWRMYMSIHLVIFVQRGSARK
jgi:hypothetical protein|uniref:Uncharacterized protein n=1 Tax=Zea mays TaxID=4577 RepID=B7ZZJ5_MAIZE|nr:unknown [Zea mays]